MPDLLSPPRAARRRQPVPARLVRWLIAILAISITLLAEVSSRQQLSFFGNEFVRDVILKLQVSTVAEPRVLIVDIDESSTAKLGPWPWPRSRVADLVEKLIGEYGARGVALDIVLPSSNDSSGNARLAMLAQHGPVVLAQALDFQHGRPQPLREGQLAGAVSNYPAGGVQATGYIANEAAFAAAPHVGNIGFIPDRDGVLRRVPLISTFDGKHYPALALALVNCCAGKGALPLENTGPMRVSFKRDWDAYYLVTAAEVLNDEIAAESIRGRLVMVGSSSLGQGDRVATPLAGSRPGLGVQAAMLSTLLDVQEGKAPSPWPGSALAIACAALSVLLATFAFPRLSAVASVALLGGLSLAWLGLVYLAAAHDPVFCTTGPLATNLFLLAVAVPYQWQLAQGRSRRLLDTLRQYVAPKVVEELLRSDLEDPLRPRQLDVTTLIADMEGYTSQVENLPVEEAATLTRTFLDCLTEPVIARDGTLDKYTGDGLVAFWGAPLPLEQHADLALDAARAIEARVAALSAERVAMGFAPLRVRIGIESGIAMAGDFGTSFRSIYTAVGDSVNTASRLEQAARDFPHSVIVGAGTVERSRRHRFVLLGERRLRGKEKPTILYTIESSMPEPSPSTPIPASLEDRA